MRIRTHHLTALFLPLLAAILISAVAPNGFAQSGPLEVRAMTFNIRYGTGNDGDHIWPNRRLGVIRVMQESGADFIGLQEAMAFQIAELRTALPDYTHYGRGRRLDPMLDEASPIFYNPKRWRIDAEQRGTFWLSDTPDEPGSTTWGNRIPRIVTWARFTEIETGRAIRIYNTHFDHESQPSRMNAARQIAQHIAAQGIDEPFVLMGDFNSGESNEAITYLKGAGDSPIALTDTFRSLHPDAAPVGTFNGFKGEIDGDKIDYLFVGPDATVKIATIHRDKFNGLWPSDHMPVSATIMWGAR